MSDITSVDGAATNVLKDWFAFRVRPRHEKSVALQLGEKNEECFLPLIRQTRRWANRLTHVDLPVIPGYIFCRSHRFGMLPILQTPGVMDVLRVGHSPVPIPAEELTALERAIDASYAIEPCAYVEVGKSVEIRRGPLAGVSGIVVERKKAQQLVLSVTLLRRSVLVHIDLCSVCDELPVLLAGCDQVA